MTTPALERACAAEYRHEEHRPHPWETPGAPGRGQASWWCPGWPRQPRAVTDPDAPVCGATYTGPTGLVWACRAPAHFSDPTVGLAGSGHHYKVARGPTGDVPDSRP